MTGDGRRSPTKILQEFEYLRSEAHELNTMSTPEEVRDWANRCNRHLGEMAAWIGHEATPAPVIVPRGAFGGGGRLNAGWVKRLKAVVADIGQAMDLLSRSPAVMADGCSMTDADNGQTHSLHRRVLVVTDKFRPDQQGDGAVFEACKHLAQRVREMTGLREDGKALMQLAFSPKNPRIRVNALEDDTDRAVQEGVMHLATGLWLAARNPRAHRPWGECDLDEILEVLSTVSYLHRQLDRAVVVEEACSQAAEATADV